MKRNTFLVVGLTIITGLAVWVFNNFNLNFNLEPGEKIDSYNGITVYYNGSVGNVVERNMTVDGYNLGLKYQCVEFVKRYYFEHLNHKMPDSYGPAKDFFDTSLEDGEKNNQRDLTQYLNFSRTKPKVDDLLIFEGSIINKYGHVAIISKVTDSEIEIIQQNSGEYGKTRVNYELIYKNGNWKIDNDRVLGWLRKEN